MTIYVEVVKKLLEAGADINARNKDGVTALMLASGYGRTGLVVTDMKGKMEIVNNDPVGNGNVEVVKALIAAKADVNIRSGKNGRTALMGASRFGSLAVIKELIAAGADVNIKDNEGCTALIEASRYGYTDVVRELLAAKTDVNIKSNDGVTALTESSKGYDNIVKLLKEAGAKE
ncbi:MAG: ankyrin repeat domain-containing protein [Smithella sp.]